MALKSLFNLRSDAIPLLLGLVGRRRLDFRRFFLRAKILGYTIQD